MARIVAANPARAEKLHGQGEIVNIVSYRKRHAVPAWGGPPGLRRASTPACSACEKSGCWRTRARSKTQRSLLGNRRVWWRPAAGVSTFARYCGAGW